MANCSDKARCSLLLLVLTLISMFSTTKQFLFYCVVTSTNETSQCPSNSVENDTLNSLVLNRRFSSSHSVYSFVDGTHVLKLPLSVYDLINFTLQGLKENATIQCQNLWNTSISFKNTSEVSIQNLTFANCLSGRLIPSTFFPNRTVLVMFAVIFEGGVNLSIARVNFVNGAIFVNNTVGKVQVAKVDVISHLFSEKYNESIGGSYFHFCKCVDEVSLLISNTRSTFTNNKSLTIPYSTSIDEKDRVQALRVIVGCTNIGINITRSSFVGFYGQGNGGGLSLVFHSDPRMYKRLISVEHCQFERGFAISGAGVFILLKRLYFASNFEDDVISEEYKSISFYNCSFTNNSALIAGAGFHQLHVTSSYSASFHLPINVTLINCTFWGNNLWYSGRGGIAMNIMEFLPMEYELYILPQYKVIVRNSIFQHNYVNTNALCSGNNGVISIIQTQFFMLVDTELSLNNCTAVLVTRGNLLTEGQVTISNNTGYSGGGLLLCADSRMFLMPFTNLLISNNSVTNAGGGICVDSLYLQTAPMCFFQLSAKVYTNRSLLDTISVKLMDNRADHYGGHNLFGGFVDHCYMKAVPKSYPIGKGIEIFNEIFKVNKSIPSSVSSIPLKVCFCLANGNISCTDSLHENKHLTYHSPEIYPGQQVNIPVIIVGQLNGFVPGSVYASTFDEHVIPASQNIQSVPHTKCSLVNYTIASNKSNEIVGLYVHYPGDVSALVRYNLLPRSYVNVSIRDCPEGFQMSKITNVCECIHMEENVVNITCDIISTKITKKSDGWIGYDRDPYHRDLNTNYFIHKQTCAYDYCKKPVVIMNVSEGRLNQDSQCRFNRTGLLCGSCSPNLSSILGSSDCWQCSNISLAWIPFFALAGVILILFLTLFNFNISEGTIGGLVFYSNVVQTGATHFFSYDNVLSDKILRVFISWISLDFGIPICLYNGMTELTKAYLQFVFPLYLWLISGLIIFLCRRYIKITHFLGKNSIKVLSTVLLLSFTKLVRAITVALSVVNVSVDLEPSNVLERNLWLKDPNVRYLHGVHISIFIVAVIFAVPYFSFVFFLLCIQCVQRCRCVSRLKPFTDCYTGPNRADARFWTGLLLLSRVLLVIGESMDDRNEADIYLISVIGVAVSLFFITRLIPGGVYTNHYHNILESFFLLNIVFLCLGVMAANKYVSIFSHHYPILISCGATFVVFWGLLFYHFYCAQLKKTRFGVALNDCLSKASNKIIGLRNEEEINDLSFDINREDERQPLLFTH